jgi:(R,R)-butanediol dehydrogenase / meso-butanediol dehydrogenase / diacetyl reductase
MKAAVYYGPGDVRIEGVREPGPPGPEEVVLQVKMGSLCGTDASQYKAATMVPLHSPHSSSGHAGPVILGHEVVGVVVARGTGVTHLEIGQRVVPGAGWWCGGCPRCQEGRINICEHYYLYGIHTDGGLAEFATFPAKMCMSVPADCADEEAAIAQPCAVAIHALARGNIAAAHTIALFGVGSIGSLLLATLQAQAASEKNVIVIDVEPGRLAVAKQLGATTQIDARRSDAVAAIDEVTGGQGVDVAIDATGVPGTIAQALTAVRRGGRLLQVGIPVTPVSLVLDTVVMQEKEIITANGQICTVDLPLALELLATTDLARRIGYRVIGLDRLVEEGLVPLVEHRATAKVVVALSEGGHRAGKGDHL